MNRYYLILMFIVWAAAVWASAKGATWFIRWQERREEKKRDRIYERDTNPCGNDVLGIGAADYERRGREFGLRRPAKMAEGK